VRQPSDLAGMRIRVLPSEIQKQTFERLGAVPMRLDLTEAVEMIKSGTIDAQENPLANTVVYGVHKFHRFHTLTGHFYISRPIFLNRDQFGSWPEELQLAMRDVVKDAVAFQRAAAVEEDANARQAIEAEGCEIAELAPDRHHAFVDAVRPLHAEARARYGAALFDCLAEAQQPAGPR
jgi:TRAP-type C4-dicarboxylate transport system substrate-binding protein